MRIASAAFATLVALTAATTVRAADEPAATASALTGPQVGAPAPAFALTTIEGKQVSLASFAGRVLVVNVWATWCPPCRLETPDLKAAEAKLRGRGVAFLGVDTTEDAPIVRAFASARGLPYAQAIDREKTFEKAYDVAYFPTTYVIDARGILRARYIDVLDVAHLDRLVADAKAERNGVIASPLQTKIDAILEDARLAIAPGDDAATVRAKARAGDAAIASAESLLDESDAARGNSTDLLRTRALEAALRDRALAALGALAAPTPGASPDGAAVTAAKAEQLFEERLRGDAARDRERWSDALDAYGAALTADVNDTASLEGLALAASRLERYDDAIDAQRRLAEIQPHDVGVLVELARTQAKAGKSLDADATFARAFAVAQANIDAKLGDAKAIRMAAYAHLYAGRTFAKAGDATRAHAEFDRMLALSARLPKNDVRHDMYLEEGQEAIVALGLVMPASGASVSLAPWTGAELPGSIPGTRKYRLVVAGAAARNVRLTTADVPKGWVATFCTNLVCAPFRTSIVIPSSGVKVVEFQLVPPRDGVPTPRVRVTSRDGAHESSATTN